MKSDSKDNNSKLQQIRAPSVGVNFLSEQQLHLIKKEEPSE